MKYPTDPDALQCYSTTAVPAWTAALRLDADSGYAGRNFIFLNTFPRYLHHTSSRSSSSQNPRKANPGVEALSEWLALAPGSPSCRKPSIPITPQGPAGNMSGPFLSGGMRACANRHMLVEVRTDAERLRWHHVHK